MKQNKLLCAAFLIYSLNLQAQSLEQNVEQRLDGFLKEYQTSYAQIGRCKLDHIEIDHQNKSLKVYTNPNFGYQPFTEENVKAIYRSVKQILPGPVNYYKITLYADSRPIEDLIPNAFRQKTPKDKSRLYPTEYQGAPWVENTSRPYNISRGMQNRHIALWQSHGKYYKNKVDQWKWQRPRLFATTEDLFTQSIVVPYLIPMLENAGAIVYTPRERDWQTNEVIVDNNSSSHKGSLYLEENYKRKYRWKETNQPGFAIKHSQYTDGQNPFIDGTARFIPTISKAEKAFAEWIPNIPATGKYAVYVSYLTLPNSITDAKYLVYHKGGVTEFKVNQQIGGATWVYLGTFEFDKGNNEYGMVVLSNESEQSGVVCADAVRFGGGMGNIVRGGKTSGLPRYLEGARYWSQWAGMPYKVYSKSKGENDYADDINVRSLATNYLSGGSVYNPSEKGIGVPLELTLGVHSDAGFTQDNSLVGSLGIYTTQYNDGKLNCGISRYASRDLVDMVLTGIQKDISAQFGIQWNRRGMWNKNYSETRLPAIPSMILETLSHQNFPDLKLGHDPQFKFTLARSVYKSLLRYTATMHDKDYVVQPLPVERFSITEGKKKNTFELNWSPVDDPAEPTATPSGYVVYTRVGYGGFDNGVYTRSPHYTAKVEPGLVYSFKITAVNKGGESFPSEILAAYKAKKSKGTVLIVNGFNRLSGPATLQTALWQGFDLQKDPGLPYQNTPAFCGYQQSFDSRQAGIETEGGLGYSGDELEGMLIAGNSFDYPFVHGKAIQRTGRHSFVSCSKQAIEEGAVSLTQYPIVDYIYGAEQTSLSKNMQTLLTQYCQQGGNLMISGAFMGKIGDSQFTSNILKYTFGGAIEHHFTGEVTGNGIRFRVPHAANERVYAVTAPHCILPSKGAFASFAFPQGGYGAGVAYKGNDYRTFVIGVPLETITQTDYQTHIMRSALHFFEEK